MPSLLFNISNVRNSYRYKFREFHIVHMYLQIHSLLFLSATTILDTRYIPKSIVDVGRRQIHFIYWVILQDWQMLDVILFHAEILFLFLVSFSVVEYLEYEEIS